MFQHLLDYFSINKLLQTSVCQHNARSPESCFSAVERVPGDGGDELKSIESKEEPH